MHRVEPDPAIVPGPGLLHGDKNPVLLFDGITAAGAAGGVALSEGAYYLSSKEAQEAYVNGYDKGRSDAVKQQYWLFVALQQAKAGDEGRVRLYPVHLPEQVIDGVIFKSTTQNLRIEE